MRAHRILLLGLAATLALAGCGRPPPGDPGLVEGLDGVPGPQGVEQEAPLPPAAPEPEPQESPPDPEADPEPPRPPPYRGLGAWIDIFDHGLWRDPEGTVGALARRDVKTLFLQTTSYRFPGPIRYPSATARFIEAAHARGINVVGWYVPDFARMRRDLAWSVAAARFTTPGGNRFDSIALDIEVTEVADPVLRAERALTLSRRLRQALGRGYPLGAIVPSPLRGPSYWPVLPVRGLAQIHDVILPMAYWDRHASGEAGAHGYIARSIEILRAEGGPDMPLHVIGGVADNATSEEMRGFRRAVRARGLLGASIYDVDSMRPGHWAELRGVADDLSSP